MLVLPDEHFGFDFLIFLFSSKVVAAFLESPDSKVRDLAKAELQPLVDRGILKISDHKAVEK